MTPQQFTQSLSKMVIELKKFIEDTGPNGAPTIVGTTASDFFTQNFDRQGFLNRGLQPWPDVKRRTNPRNTPRGKTAAGRRILFGETRNLSRSIDYDAQKGKVIIFSDVHYAPYHNQGTSKLPKRQFIGDSAELDKLVISELDKKIKNIIK